MFNFNFSLSDLKHTKFYQQVLAEGEARAETKGEADIFSLLLEHRFGPLSPKIQQRIASADSTTLRLWAKRLLDAKSLDDVWGH